MLLMVGAYLVATDFVPRILSTHLRAWSIFLVSYMGEAYNEYFILLGVVK